MGITRGWQPERNECWELSKTTGLTWLPQDKAIALSICPCGVWWVEIASPCPRLGLPWSCVAGLRGPRSKLTTVIKDGLYWTSFKPPSPALCPSHLQHGQNGIPLSPALFFTQRTAPQGLQINCVQHIFPVIFCAFLGCQPHGLNRVCACWCLHWYYLADPASWFASSSMEKCLAFHRDASNNIM